MRVPTGGIDPGVALFITASVAAVITPPLRSAIDAHVSPERTT